MKKLSKIELQNIFQKASAKHRYDNYVLSNIGNKNLAVTDAFGFSDGDDLVAIYEYCFGGREVYLELSDAENLNKFNSEIKKSVEKVKEVMFSSFDSDLLSSNAFEKIFGRFDVNKSEQYGMLKRLEINTAFDEKASVRLLTKEDGQMVERFDEPFVRFRNNLRNAFETRIKKADTSYRIYAYIDDSNILGYLIANTLDGKYWDVAYVYVTENARGKGIAKKLARCYAAEISVDGGFASYGTPENDISKKVAESCGFEVFETRYYISWQPTSSIKTNTMV